jgi:hypothetical protein
MSLFSAFLESDFGLIFYHFCFFFCFSDVFQALLEPDSKYKVLKGITAAGYLGKAKNMFEEMDLPWDLDELDKVMASSGGLP